MSELSNNLLLERAVELAESTGKRFIVEYTASVLNSPHIDLDEVRELIHELETINGEHENELTTDIY